MNQSIRRIPVLIALAAFLIVAAIPSAGASTQSPLDRSSRAEEDSRIPGRYIVVFKDSVERPGNLAETQTEQRDGELGFVYRSAIKGYSAELSKGAVEALRNDPRVKFVSPDYKVEVAAQSIPTGVSRIHATENKELDIDEVDDVRVNADVAVIDTGVFNHTDISVAGWTNCVPPGEDVEKEAGIEECIDNTGADGEGHGTHVAGTIAAIDNGKGVVGVAPGARIWSVRVLNDEGDGAWSWVIAGIDWVTATRQDEDPKNDIEVANMSLSCSTPCYEPAAELAIGLSAQEGVVHVVAAGNKSDDANLYSPGSSPIAITVSALADYDGKAGGEGKATCANWGSDDTRARFSNFGSRVDIAAPGVCINSTLPNNEYGSLSGTSMASPHVAGAAAILASQSNPDSKEDVEAIRNTLVSNGNLRWVDTSEDGIPEPLLHLGTQKLSAATLSATNVDSDAGTATLRGSVDPGGPEASYYFEYGTDTSYGQSAPLSPKAAGSGLDAITVSESIGGLKLDTTYHYRVVATNSSKETFYGADQTVTPGSWKVESTPNVGLGGLWGISCTSITHCLAVGEKGGTYLVERFDGSKWQVETLPTPSGTIQSRLEGVSCTSSSACTAVGEYTNSSGTKLTLAERWNGKEWAVESTPNPPEAISSSLQDVSCISSTACVAVGSYTKASYPFIRYAFAEHWDGSKWTIQVTPRETGYVQRDRVSCTAANACTAVRHGVNLEIPVVERWNGSEWKAQEVAWPEPKGTPPYFFNIFGVACLTGTECTAVGTHDANSVSSTLLAERWNGTEWKVEAGLPKAGSHEVADLRNVFCASSSACMAIGQNQGFLFSLYWDGADWELQGVSGSGYRTQQDVACLGSVAKTCFAVGKVDDRPLVVSRKIKPTATTGPATNVSGAEATLTGTVNPEGGESTYYFEYGPTEAYGSKAPVSPKGIGSGDKDMKVSESISGLKAATTYHYRVVATNPGGTSFGKDETFTTWGSWSTQSTPNPSPKTEVKLEAVSCASSTMCVGVGHDLYTDKGISRSWNGSEWTDGPGSGPGKLDSVHCPSATSCIVVGNTNLGAPRTARWKLTSGIWFPNGGEGAVTPKDGSEVNLKDVSCTSESACTAVGSYYDGTRRVTLAERWNGTEWTIQTTANPETGSAELLGVSCDSASSCTAVGKKGTETFAERWNGTTWSISTTPNPAGATGSLLEDVSCTSGSFCTAVGSYTETGTGTPRKSLAVKWNGTSWSIATTPSPAGSKSSSLLDVSCVSSTSCAAVGRYVNASTAGELGITEEKTLALSWGGSEWALQTSPNPEGKKLPRLAGVSCSSATACTAVGWATKASSEAETVMLAERWNGTAWSTQSTPNPSPKTEVKLEAVSCASSTMCMSVGTNLYTDKGISRSWNGSEWTDGPGSGPGKLDSVHCPSATSCIVVGNTNLGAPRTARWKLTSGIWFPNGGEGAVTPKGGTEVNLKDVSCTSESACTAVGSYYDGTRRVTLAERWNGTEWSIQTTANPETGNAELLGVSCDSASSCTAVGKKGTETFAERWNGTTWSISTTTNPGGATGSLLEDVSCTSGSFCTAVGSYTETGTGTPRKSLAERWDGKSWSIVSTPSPAGSKSSSLLDVACASSTSCAAVGRYVNASTAGETGITEEKTLALSWGGTEWALQTTPNPEGKKLPRLAGVSCSSATACTAVGWAKKASNEAETVTLAERYE